MLRFCIQTLKTQTHAPGHTVRSVVCVKLKQDDGAKKKKMQTKQRNSSKTFNNERKYNWLMLEAAGKPKDKQIRRQMKRATVYLDRNGETQGL